MYVPHICGTYTQFIQMHINIMASKISTPIGISSILLIILGIIMLIIGVVLLIVNQNVEKAWYIWFLLILGVIFVVAGSIMLAIALQPAEPKYLPVVEQVE